MSPTMVCDSGISVPMPSPWLARPTINIPKLCDRPDTIEPIMNTTRPPK